MSLKKNLLKNGLATGLQKIIRIAEQLLLVPFFITAWGAEYYGEWLTLTIIPTMLAFSDLGFGTSAANKFLLQYAGGDKQGAADTAKTGFTIISFVVVLAFVLSALTVFLLDHFDVFEKSLIQRTDAIWAVSLLMAARILNFYNQLFEAQYRAARKAARSMNYQSIYATATIAGGFLVLILGFGVISFAAINLFVTVLFTPFFAIKARQTLGLHHEFKGQFQSGEIREIAAKGFGYLMSPVWQAIYFQGTTFIIRLTLGPLAVAVFNTVRTVSRTVNQIFNMITLSVFPELQYEIGSGNMARARKLFRVTFSTIILSAIGGILFLSLFGLWFYQIWTSKSLTPPTAMWYLFIAGIGFNALWWSGEMVFRAVNQPYRFAVAGVLAALVSVGCTYLFSTFWGLAGAAAGALILDVLLAFYVLPVGLKILKMPARSMVSDFIQTDLPGFKQFMLTYRTSK